MKRGHWAGLAGALGMVGIVLYVGVVGSDQGREDPGGPCYDEDGYVVGNPSVRVGGGGRTVGASFGSDLVGYCPWVGRDGQATGDGFLGDLEQRRLAVEPGEVLTLYVPGYPDATVTVVARGEAFPPQGLDEERVDSASWSVVAPVEPGTYTMGISLEWPYGESGWAVMLDVGVDAPISDG